MIVLGAFTFFSPGVFWNSDIYTQLLLSAANGKLSFAGEATSVMRTWSRCPSFERASDPTLINSWVAGALDSAWRAVDQYIDLNQKVLPPGIQGEFHAKWGSTEYWDETSNEGLVELDRKLMERYLEIGLCSVNSTPVYEL